MGCIKLGTGSYKERLTKSLDYCLSHFDVLELQDFIMPDNLENPALIKEYRVMLAGFEGEITLHGPYLNLAPTSIDKLVKVVAERRYLQGVEAAQKIGAQHLVVHSFYDTTTGYQGYDRMWLDDNVKFWTAFLDKIRGSGVTILLENVYDRNPETFAELIAIINSPHFRSCIDLGHANCLSDYHPCRWIERVGGYYLHISDNNGRNDGHLGIGCGNIDYLRISRELASYPELYLISEVNDEFEKQFQGLQWLKKMITDGEFAAHHLTT